jgi:hypothetical protein
VHPKTILVSTLVVLTALFTAAASAQTNSGPGTEVKKLDYFVGTWTTEGTIPQGPWGMGGTFTSTRTGEFMPGNFFVESHSDFKMPSGVGGDGKSVSFMGYDAGANQYTFDDFNSHGRRQVAAGTVSGDTWTFTSTQNYAGQEVKQKTTMKVLSPASYSLKIEVSLDGTNWMTFMDAKTTKK